MLLINILYPLFQTMPKNFQNHWNSCAKTWVLQGLFFYSTHTLQEDARSSCGKPKFPYVSYGSMANSVTWILSICARPEVLASWLFGDSSFTEAWLICRIRSSRLTRQRALWYLSSLGQAEWNWLDSANVSQGRTGQDRAGWGQNGERAGYFLGFSPSTLFWQPIIKFTFVWHNFSP